MGSNGVVDTALKTRGGLTEKPPSCSPNEITGLGNTDDEDSWANVEQKRLMSPDCHSYHTVGQPDITGIPTCCNGRTGHYPHIHGEKRNQNAIEPPDQLSAHRQHKGQSPVSTENTAKTRRGNAPGKKKWY